MDTFTICTTIIAILLSLVAVVQTHRASNLSRRLAERENLKAPRIDLSFPQSRSGNENRVIFACPFVQFQAWQLPISIVVGNTGELAVEKVKLVLEMPTELCWAGLAEIEMVGATIIGLKHQSQQHDRKVSIVTFTIEEISHGISITLKIPVSIFTQLAMAPQSDRLWIRAIAFHVTGKSVSQKLQLLLLDTSGRCISDAIALHNHQSGILKWWQRMFHRFRMATGKEKGRIWTVQEPVMDTIKDTTMTDGREQSVSIATVREVVSRAIYVWEDYSGLRLFDLSYVDADQHKKGMPEKN